jgi:hypothetical protein
MAAVTLPWCAKPDKNYDVAQIGRTRMYDTELSPSGKFLLIGFLAITCFILFTPPQLAKIRCDFAVISNYDHVSYSVVVGHVHSN